MKFIKAYSDNGMILVPVSSIKVAFIEYEGFVPDVGSLVCIGFGDPDPDSELMYRSKAIYSMHKKINDDELQVYIDAEASMLELFDVLNEKSQ